MPQRFDDLPPETQKFLLELREEEIETLEDGIRLVRSIQTVGSFVKWVLVALIGMAVGSVMFFEALGKLWQWFRPPPG